MDSRGQVSLEYMTMLGLSLIIFAAVLYVATYLTATSSTQIDIDTAYRAVLGIKEHADFIYVHGFPSKIQAGIRFPSGMENVSIKEKVAKIRLSVGESFTDIYAVTKANMSGSAAADEICDGGICAEGYYIITFNATNPDFTQYDVNVSIES